MKLAIEVPFPTDCAPYKIVRYRPDGRGVIVTAAQTREAAERRLAELSKPANPQEHTR